MNTNLISIIFIILQNNLLKKIQKEKINFLKKYKY